MFPLSVESLRRRRHSSLVLQLMMLVIVVESRRMSSCSRSRAFTNTVPPVGFIGTRHLNELDGGRRIMQSLRSQQFSARQLQQQRHQQQGGLHQSAILGTSSTNTKSSAVASSTKTTTTSTSLSMVSSKSGAKLITSEEEYTELVLNPSLEKPVLVFFTAPWCGPCRLSIPVVKEVMKLYSNQMDGVEVCTDDLPEVASDSNVVSIPTIQMYYKGQCMDTIVGCVAKSVLSNAVEKVLEDSSLTTDGASSADDDDGSSSGEI